MYKYNKILVGLGHRESDLDLIKATFAVSELSGSKEIIFLNILKDFNLPENLQKEFPNLLESAISERKKHLQKQIDDHFSPGKSDVEIKIIVTQGQRTKSILKYAAHEKVDLIVLGKDNENKGSSVLIGRIARRATCSLLIIPRSAEFKAKNILVPTDFSDYSKSALEKAIVFANRSGDGSKITVQNVFLVPTGYHYTGKSFTDFSKIMEEHARNDYNKFIRNVNLRGVKLEDIYTLDKDDDIINDIYKVAKKIKADLITIGAKGRTATSALFIGSKAEKLIQVDHEIPLLVVRPKGKRLGLLDFIREM